MKNDAQNIESLLYSLELLLIEKEVPIIKYLNNGIQSAEIKKIATELEIDFSEELYYFFEWKNGIDYLLFDEVPFGYFYLFTLAIPLSIQLSVDIYINYSLKNTYWNKGYFPIFESGGGDYLLLNLDKKSEEFGMVMKYSPSNPYFEDVISYSDSLTSLFETLLECYKRNGYYINRINSPFLVENSELAYSIWASNNPKSNYWKRIVQFSKGIPH